MEKLMFDKQILIMPCSDNESGEDFDKKALVRFLLVYRIWFVSSYSYLTVLAPSGNSPSIFSSFRKLMGWSKFLSESLVLKNNQAKETCFGVANSAPSQ